MRVNYIELAGRKYPLCFSMAATEEICETFGSTDKMFETIKSEDVLERFHAFDKILGIFLKAGRKYCELINEPVPEELKGRPADYIDMSDPDALSVIFKTFAADSETKVETVSKNAEPTPEA